MYRIELHKRAQKDIRKLDSQIRVAALNAADELADFPHVTELKRMTGPGYSENTWRKKFRRDWRMLFVVDDVTMVITVFRVDKRSDVYK